MKKDVLHELLAAGTELKVCIAFEVSELEHMQPACAFEIEENLLTVHCLPAAQKYLIMHVLPIKISVIVRL